MGRFHPIDWLRESPDLWPPNWPIRRKLTGLSAGVTFVILVVFGLALGSFATGQLQDNFADETFNQASELAAELEASGALTPGLPASDVVRILDKKPDGADLLLLANRSIYRAPGSPSLGPATDAGVSNWGRFQVATILIQASNPTQPSLREPVAVLRFGREVQPLDRQVGNLWLSILAGTLGASLLAGLAAAVLSQRALRPLGRLTRAAGQIAITRDPEMTLPEPDGEDEVVELTRSFNEMLHELSLARGERERSLTRQREFVADASHELRTPLTSVLANLELLGDSRNLAPDSSEREALDSALRSGLRMKRLVSDLQILARADAGRSIEMVPSDLGLIADDVVIELGPISDDHELSHEVVSAARLDGVPDDLHRLVLNLVDNAIRHTPRGSSIRIRTGTDGSSVFLEVADDGVGIPDDLKPTIFNRFIRSKDSSDRVAGSGSGLGLAIVSAIAKEHHARASVSDAPGGGAMFRVDFPSEKGRETLGKP